MVRFSYCEILKGEWSYYILYTISLTFMLVVIIERLDQNWWLISEKNSLYIPLEYRPLAHYYEMIRREK